MLVLVNYSKEEKERLPILGSILKKHNIQAIASHATYGISDLLATAKKGHANAVIVANEGTLQNLVQTPNKAGATLSTFRGSRLNFSIPVLVIAPLEQLHTIKYGRFLLEQDIAKLAFLDKKPLQLKFKVLETVDDFVDAEWILEKALLISIDIETDEYSRITCISFTGLLAPNKTYTCVIPFIDFGLDHFDNPHTYTWAIQCMQSICMNKIPKMMFNNTYDAAYLIRYHAWPNNLVIDVMGLAHSQYSELPKTLDFTASLYCYDYYYWKHEADLARKNKDIRAYWGYCAKDSWWTLRALLYMMPQYPEYALKNYQMLYKLTFPCLYCAFEGILVDNKAREKVLASATTKLSQSLKNLQIMAADPNFNPGSPKQVATFLYDIIGARTLTTKKKDKHGNVTEVKSTNEKVLKRVMEQHPLLTRIVDDLLTYRGEAKAIGTYFKFAQLNGRLMYQLGPFAADTARFSSHASNFTLRDEEGEWKNYGTQIQNIPEYAKEMLIADDGWELFEADNSKSEARCVAYFSSCKLLKDALADDKRDFYKILATIFFGTPYEQVTKEFRDRVMKRIIHGIHNMMGVDGYINTVGVKEILVSATLLHMKVDDLRKFVTYLLSIYHKRFPEVHVFHNEVRREILRTHKFISPGGYTRYFFGDIVNNHKIMMGASAHAQQNLSVVILNKGFWKVYKLVVANPTELRLKAQIHDSNFGQYKQGFEDKYRPLILEAMNNPVRIHDDMLSIPVDWKHGLTWKALKDG